MISVGHPVHRLPVCLRTILMTVKTITMLTGI